MPKVSHTLKMIVKVVGGKEASKQFDKITGSFQRMKNKLPGLNTGLNGIKKVLGGMGALLKGIAIPLGIVAVGIATLTAAAAAAVKVLGPLVKAYANQQDALVRFGVSLQSVGQFTAQAVRDMAAFAGAIQVSSRFADDEIIRAAATISQLGRVYGKELQQATQAATDFAVVTGRGLATAALLMAKAAQGVTSEMTRYGLVLDENIPKSERFAAALKLMQENFGGTAAAEVRSLAGAWSQFGFAVGDAMEVLGVLPGQVAQRILPRLSAVFLAFNDKHKDFLSFIPETAERAFDDLERIASRNDIEIKFTKGKITFGRTLAKINEALAGDLAGKLSRITVGDAKNFFGNLPKQYDKLVGDVFETIFDTKPEEAKILIRTEILRGPIEGAISLVAELEARLARLGSVGTAEALRSIKVLQPLLEFAKQNLELRLTVDFAKAESAFESFHSFITRDTSIPVTIQITNDAEIQARMKQLAAEQERANFFTPEGFTEGANLQGLNIAAIALRQMSEFDTSEIGDKTFFEYAKALSQVEKLTDEKISEILTTIEQVQGLKIEMQAAVDVGDLDRLKELRENMKKFFLDLDLTVPIGVAMSQQLLGVMTFMDGILKNKAELIIDAKGTKGLLDAAEATQKLLADARGGGVKLLDEEQAKRATTLIDAVASSRDVLFAAVAAGLPEVAAAGLDQMVEALRAFAVEFPERTGEVDSLIKALNVDIRPSIVLELETAHARNEIERVRDLIISIHQLAGSNSIEFIDVTKLAQGAATATQLLPALATAWEAAIASGDPSVVLQAWQLLNAELVASGIATERYSSEVVDAFKRGALSVEEMVRQLEKVEDFGKNSTRIEMLIELDRLVQAQVEIDKLKAQVADFPSLEIEVRLQRLDEALKTAQEDTDTATSGMLTTLGKLNDLLFKPMADGFGDVLNSMLKNSQSITASIARVFFQMIEGIIANLSDVSSAIGRLFNKSGSKGSLLLDAISAGFGLAGRLGGSDSKGQGKAGAAGSSNRVGDSLPPSSVRPVALSSIVNEANLRSLQVIAESRPIAVERFSKRQAPTLQPVAAQRGGNVHLHVSLNETTTLERSMRNGSLARSATELMRRVG